MKNRKNICVIIQARLNSQRIPRKMIKNFCGTNLTEIALNKIKSCKSFSLENFYLSVHEKELADIGKDLGVNVFQRSERSANSEGTPMTEIYEWWDKLPYEYCVLVNACNPFLKSETIDKFFEKYCEIESDGLFGVIEKKNYFWNDKFALMNEWPKGHQIMNTKYVCNSYEAAHCLYAGKMKNIGDGIWMGDFLKPGDISLFPMSEKESIDIDYDWQFKMCEILYKGGFS